MKMIILAGGYGTCISEVGQLNLTTMIDYEYNIKSKNLTALHWMDISTWSAN
jgi:hypothetical protein